MKRSLPVFLLLATLAGDAQAADVAGVDVPPAVTVNGRELSLNGAGVRKKFVFDVYVGSLYTPQRVSTPDELLNAPGDKLVRLDILRDKVEKERILGAFEEGFANNAPEIARSPDARRFLTLFKADFYKGDRIDLFLGGDGTIAASHNGKALGTLRSSPLVRGILKVWVGEKPADEKLKRRMLGH